MATKAVELCDEDFYAWTRRRLPKACARYASWHREVLAEAGVDLADGPERVENERRRKRKA